MTSLRKAAIQAKHTLANVRDFLWSDQPGWSAEDQLEEVRKALDELNEALETEPQPVAWMHTNGVGNVYFRKKPQDKVFNPQPLYAASPQRKPLSDEKVCDLWSWSMTTEAESTATTQQHAFARAIEREHGIT